MPTCGFSFLWSQLRCVSNAFGVACVQFCFPVWVWARCAKARRCWADKLRDPLDFLLRRWASCGKTTRHGKSCETTRLTFEIFCQLEVAAANLSRQSHFSGLIGEAWKWNKRADKLLQSVLKIQRVSDTQTLRGGATGD